MRGDQPERRLASPIVDVGCTCPTLPQTCEGRFSQTPRVRSSPRVRTRPRGGRHRPAASSRPRRRWCPRWQSRWTVRGPETKRVAGGDLDRLQLVADATELESSAAFPGRAMTRPWPRGTGGSTTRRRARRGAPRVGVGLGPHELPAPRLLDPTRRHAVTRAGIPAHENRIACSGMVWPAPIRNPWSSTFPSPMDAPGPTTARL